MDEEEVGCFDREIAGCHFADERLKRRFHRLIAQLDIPSEEPDHATRWLRTYNNERPDMGIGGTTPAQKLKRAA